MNSASKTQSPFALAAHSYALPALGTLLLVALSAGSRLWFETPNFSAAGAVALFAGCVFARRGVALSVVLFAMLVGDAVLGFYNPVVMASVYLAMCINVALGRSLVRPMLTQTVQRAGLAMPFRALGAGLLGSVLFFLCTNFAVWASDGLYAQSLAGLVECYTLALPFFRHTLTSDALFVGVLFSGLVVVRWLAASRATASNRTAVARA